MLLADEDRQEHLALAQRPAQYLRGRGLRVDQVEVFRKRARDRRARLGAVGAQPLEIAAHALDACRIALAGGQRLGRGEDRGKRLNLLTKILFAPDQCRDARIAGERARARRRQRPFHRPTAHGLDRLEGFGRHIAAAAFQRQDEGLGDAADEVVAPVRAADADVVGVDVGAIGQDAERSRSRGKPSSTRPTRT